MVRLLKMLSRSVPPALLASSILCPRHAVGDESLTLFRRLDMTTPLSGLASAPPLQGASAFFSQNGDLMIQCGSIRLILAYCPPVDRSRPPVPQPENPRQQTSGLIGIGLTAQLSF